MRAILLPLLLLPILAACRDGEASPPQTPPLQHQAARDAADTSLRARLRQSGAVDQRGVQVFAQAMPDQFAVCGRSRVAGLGSEPYMPYVALVSFESGAARVAQFSLGASGPEASRVFMLMVDRCFEGGGPASARMTARSFPPMPSATIPESPAEAPLTPATAEAPVVEATPVMVVSTARSGANIRSSTRGGEVVRTVPASSRMEVIGSPAGDWVQVGANGAAWGWIHSSMLEAPAAR